MRIIQSFIIVLFVIFTTGTKNNQSEIREKNFPKVEIAPGKMPDKKNVWVFVLAGQSNMAGRAFVEPCDTVCSNRVMTINNNKEIIFAKEPIHFYEPQMKGLGSGLAFGKHLIKYIPDSISVLLIPCAVGGSSISQWLGDSLHRNIRLLTNLKEKVEIGKKYGQIKGILWHQGESDAKDDKASKYQMRLSQLMCKLRLIVGNDKVTIMIGKLGSYSNNPLWPVINKQIDLYASFDKNTVVVETSDFHDKGDKIHFDAISQRTLGKRYAETFIQELCMKAIKKE